MNRHLLALIPLAFSAASFADPMTLNLDAIKLNELTKIAYSDILHTGYIADDEFNRDEKTVTVRLNGQSPNDIRDAINMLIQENGYSIRKQGSAVYITKRKDEKQQDQKTTFYYQPKFRNVQYITDLVGSVFENGRFTFQRPVAATSTLSDTSISSDTPKPVDTGTNAYSQQSRNYDSFIFYGNDKEINQLKSLLTQVDVPSGEILVKAYIYEVTDTNLDSDALSTVIKVLNAKLGSAADLSTVDNALHLKEIGIQAVFSAIKADSRFKQVSSPSLRVKDHETARFSVGSSVPVLGAVTYPNSGQSVQSVEYKDSGVILQIQPTIRADSIELDIKQQISNFTTTTTGVNNSPTLIKRELSSVVNSQNDDVIVLGGLDDSKANSGRTGFAWLPSFLSGKTNDSSKTEILLVLHVTRL